MPIEDLLKKIQFYYIKNPDYWVYLNTDSNVEDLFVVAETDAGNLDIVPMYHFDELKNSQEFTYI